MGVEKHARDMQIATLAMEGMPVGEIARRLSLHRNTVSKRLKRSETRQFLATLLKELVEQTTRDMLARHKMLDQATEAKHTQKRIRRQGHRPQDGYAPIERYLAHCA